MRLSQIIRNGFICFELDTRYDPPDDPETNMERYLRAVKRDVITELSELFNSSGLVANRNKLFIDLWNREKRSTTAMGQGIAIPHVRSMQARDLALGFARSTDGVPFEAPDGEPVHLFFAVIGPKHEEATYLRIYRQIARLFHYPAAFDRLMDASEDWEIFRVLDGHIN